MALRKTIFANGEIYHVFNCSVQKMPIFKGDRECRLFLKAMEYYLQPYPQAKFSVYRTSPDKFPIILGEKLVKIINYCLMPTHFHFTLQQEKEDGIKKFIQRLSNSFAHYFRIKYKSSGHLFKGSFKAVRIEDDEQLLHVSRYIHLNPVTSYLVENLEDYPYSSYNIYLGRELSRIVETAPVLDNFPSVDKYRKFVLDQKDYQRTLDAIKHIVFE